MKKVLIIGGGFAGSNTAKKLENDFSVTLIDSKDYFEFTPGVLRSIVDPSHLRNIQILHTHYLNSSKVITDCVTKVSSKEVHLNKQKIRFDYLVICSGSYYSSPIKEHNVLMNWRGSSLRSHYDDLCKAKKVLIIGGGLVGVEIAAEILEKYPDKKVTIVQSRDELMPRTPEKARQYAESYLKKKGAKIVFGHKLKSFKKGVGVTDKGKKLSADIAFFCTGIAPNSDFVPKKYKDEKGYIKVNECLQLENHKNLFAIGDCNSIREEKLAQNAIIQSEVVVTNIHALETDNKLEIYHSKPRAMVISLGKNKGIFIYKNFVLTGTIPAFMKWAIEKIEMAKH